MNYLLDTHALIWAIEDSPGLSAPARHLISMPDNRLFISPASVYEIGYKITIGKLAELPVKLTPFLTERGYNELAMTLRHAELASRLSLQHRDPFDRLIAAQAICEDMIVITRDAQLASLGASTIW